MAEGCHPVCVCVCVCVPFLQEEEEGILGSSFGDVGRSVAVLDLPESEALFMPTNMDSSQMAFKFKEVLEMMSLSVLLLSYPVWCVT